MEIGMNMLQPMAQPVTAETPAVGAAPVGTASVQPVDGVFAAFFTQMLGAAQPQAQPAAPLLLSPSGEDPGGKAEEGENPKETADALEKVLLPADPSAQLQAMALMHQVQSLMTAPKPVDERVAMSEVESDRLSPAIDLVDSDQERHSRPAEQMAGSDALPEDSLPSTTKVEPQVQVQKPAQKGMEVKSALSADAPPIPAAQPPAQGAPTPAQVRPAQSITQMAAVESAAQAAPAQTVLQPEAKQADGPRGEKGAMRQVSQNIALAAEIAGGQATEPLEEQPRKVAETSEVKTPMAEQVLPQQQKPVAIAGGNHQSLRESAEPVEGTTESTPRTIQAAARESQPPEQTDSGEQREQQPSEKGSQSAQSTTSLSAEGLRVAENRVQATPQQTAETAPLPEHEHIINQVKEKLALHDVNSGKGEISFILHPEELGELKIMLRMDDQRLKVEVIAQNQTVKDALMQNLDGLRETLSRQNITVDRFDVSTGGGNFNQAFQEGRQTGHNRFNQPYPQFSAKTATETEQKTAGYWQPRENSLVDVRF